MESVHAGLVEALDGRAVMALRDALTRLLAQDDDDLVVLAPLITSRLLSLLEAPLDATLHRDALLVLQRLGLPPTRVEEIVVGLLASASTRHLKAEVLVTALGWLEGLVQPSPPCLQALLRLIAQERNERVVAYASHVLFGWGQQQQVAAVVGARADVGRLGRRLQGVVDRFNRDVGLAVRPRSLPVDRLCVQAIGRLRALCPALGPAAAARVAEGPMFVCPQCHARLPWADDGMVRRCARCRVAMRPPSFGYD
jgi:hypothetical protein